MSNLLAHVAQYQVYTNSNSMFYFKKSTCITNKLAGYFIIFLLIKFISMLNIFLIIKISMILNFNLDIIYVMHIIFKGKTLYFEYFEILTVSFNMKVMVSAISG